MNLRPPVGNLVPELAAQGVWGVGEGCRWMLEVVGGSWNGGAWQIEWAISNRRGWLCCSYTVFTALRCPCAQDQCNGNKLDSVNWLRGWDWWVELTTHHQPPQCAEIHWVWIKFQLTKFPTGLATCWHILSLDLTLRWHPVVDAHTATPNCIMLGFEKDKEQVDECLSERIRLFQNKCWVVFSFFPLESRLYFLFKVFFYF